MKEKENSTVSAGSGRKAEETIQYESEINRTQILYRELLTDIPKGEILQRISAILEREYNLAFVWFGILDKPSENMFTPLAFTGSASDYVRTLDSITISSTPEYEAVQTKKPVLVDNMAESSRSPYFTSCLIIPFPAGASLRGFLGLYSKIENNFQEEELPFLTQLVSDINLVVSKSRNPSPRRIIQKELSSWIKLQEKEHIIDKQKEREKILGDFSKEIVQSLSVDTVIDYAVKSVSELLSPDLILVYLKRGHELDLYQSYSPENRVTFEEGSVHTAGECLCGQSVVTGEFISSEDITIDLRCTRNECKQAGLTSFAAIPLISRGNILGLISIATRFKNNFEVNRPFLETLGGQFAVGLANALLFAEVNQKAENLQKELKEKNILLKEIHHRVKNNLNVISSLLNLQLGEIDKGKNAKEAFKESRNRINAMSQIHQKLYETGDFSEIEIKPYLLNVANDLMTSYSREKNISLDWDTQNIFLTINTAIPFGLIFTEVMTNAIKYAFPDGSPGTIRISLKQQGGNILLSVKDNGIGIPESINPENHDSLGLTLIHLLTDQISGTVNISNDKGTEVIIQFPG